MEVQRVGKTEVHRVQAKEEAAAASVSFTEVMGKKRESVVHEKMMRLIGDIEEQGKILAESRTVEDLRENKLVKSFCRSGEQRFETGAAAGLQPAGTDEGL